MGARENLEVHTRWTDAQDSHDLSQHHEYVHDDIEVHVPGGKPIVGIDAVRAGMEANYEAMPDYHVVLDDQFATDERVVCRWRVSGTPKGELFGIPPSGKPIEVVGVSIWEFDEGKARRGWIFSNAASLKQQAGRDVSGAPS